MDGTVASPILVVRYLYSGQRELAATPAMLAFGLPADINGKLSPPPPTPPSTARP